ncbi:MAG: hydrolase [Ignavibacteriales bacterium]|nr:MAG: hydrolase [Ignavibacteriales bacterium]
MQLKRNPKILSADSTALLIIDIQEKILGVMNNPEMVISNTIKLIKGFKVLGLPIFFTEQYPKGLGPTAPQIAEELDGLTPIQKMTFSCFGAENLFKEISEKNISQVVVAGIESHVCVQQTALDLIANDIQVNIAADAVSSRKELDYKTALERMRTHGAEITTAESVLFELLNMCGTDQFKAVSKIVK